MVRKDAADPGFITWKVSVWVAANKERVRMVAEDRTLETGKRLIHRACRDDTWTIPDLVEAMIEPEDLIAAIDAVGEGRDAAESPQGDAVSTGSGQDRSDHSSKGRGGRRSAPGGRAVVGRIRGMDLTLPSGTLATITHTEGATRGLVVIPDIWGLRPLFEDMCASIAERTGWTVVSFEPFPGQSLPGADAEDGMARRSEALFARADDELLADAVAAAAETGCEHVSLVGFCMGGMYALKATATGRFERVASFYGMAHVPPNWAGPGQGDPVEALTRRGDTGVIAFIGTEDALIPAGHADDLETAGVDVHRYEGAQHGFVHDPSRPVHRPADAADAWSKALEFLAGA